MECLDKRKAIVSSQVFSLKFLGFFEAPTKKLEEDIIKHDKKEIFIKSQDVSSKVEKVENI